MHLSSACEALEPAWPMSFGYWTGRGSRSRPWRRGRRRWTTSSSATPGALLARRRRPAQLSAVCSRPPTAEGGLEMPATVVLTFRNLIKNLRTPMLVIASVAQPLVWLVMFSQTFSRLADTPLLRGLGYRSYLALLVPGMMVLAVLFTGLQSGLAMVSDIDSGMLDKLRISRLSILLGRVLADSVTMVAQGAVVLGVGALMGARVETGWLGTFGMLASVALLGVVGASFANLIALRGRNAELTMVAGIFVTLPALFLSPAFLPLRFQPNWVQAVARINPASYVIDVGQRLMSIGNDWGQDVGMLGVLAAAALVLMPATVAAFRAATR